MSQLVLPVAVVRVEGPLLTGALTIWSSISLGRTVGNALYLIGTVVLLAVAVAVLLVE